MSASAKASGVSALWAARTVPVAVESITRRKPKPGNRPRAKGMTAPRDMDPPLQANEGSSPGSKKSYLQTADRPSGSWMPSFCISRSLEVCQSRKEPREKLVQHRAREMPSVCASRLGKIAVPKRTESLIQQKMVAAFWRDWTRGVKLRSAKEGFTAREKRAAMDPQTLAGVGILSVPARRLSPDGRYCSLAASNGFFRDRPLTADPFYRKHKMRACRGSFSDLV